MSAFFWVIHNDTVDIFALFRIREKGVNEKDEQFNMFWTQGDFGYIKERLDEKMFMCFPQEKVVYLN